MPQNSRKGGKRRSSEKRRLRMSRLRDPSAANPTIMAIQSIDWGVLGELFGLRTVSRGQSYHEQGW